MRGVALAAACLTLLVARPARAFWVLNFSTGQTLDPGRVAFIGGTGGQLTVVGDPLRTSYTPFLAHAGIRVGLVDGIDVMDDNYFCSPTTTTSAGRPAC